MDLESNSHPTHKTLTTVNYVLNSCYRKKEKHNPHLVPLSVYHTVREIIKNTQQVHKNCYAVTVVHNCFNLLIETA